MPQKTASYPRNPGLRARLETVRAHLGDIFAPNQARQQHPFGRFVLVRSSSTTTNLASGASSGEDPAHTLNIDGASGRRSPNCLCKRALRAKSSRRLENKVFLDSTDSSRKDRQPPASWESEPTASCVPDSPERPGSGFPGIPPTSAYNLDFPDRVGFPGDHSEPTNRRTTWTSRAGPGSSFPGIGPHHRDGITSRSPPLRDVRDGDDDLWLQLG